MAELIRITRYPVKSLAGEDLDRQTLTAGRGLPGDRQLALAHGASAYDPAAPAWQPKGNFVNLVRTERLARLTPAWDPESGTLTVRDDAGIVGEGAASGRGGWADLEAALTAWLGDDARGGIHVAAAPGVAFTDVPGGLVSILNLASVRDLEAAAGVALDPARFRANLVIDGLRPWGEFDWVGRQATAGGATLKVVEPITRCAATHVDPATAARDVNVVGLLERHAGHAEMGVYAEVAAGGEVRPGDAVCLR